MHIGGGSVIYAFTRHQRLKPSANVASINVTAREGFERPCTRHAPFAGGIGDNRNGGHHRIPESGYEHVSDLMHKNAKFSIETPALRARRDFISIQLKNFDGHLTR